MIESRFNIWVDKGSLQYVYNGLTGALLCIEREERDGLTRYLAGEHTHGMDDSTLADLTAGKMLLPDGTDELQALEEFYVRTRGDFSHLGLTILPSLGCNFDCPYCFEAKYPSIMSLEVRKAVQDFAKSRLDSLRSIHVEWFGGEPLVGRNALFDLSDRLIALSREANIKYSASIITNGYLLDLQTCQELQRVGVQHAQVSLDGPPSVHDAMRPLRKGGGTFHRIVHNLHNTIGRFAVTVRVNVDRGNTMAAEELLKILHDEGFSGKLNVYIGHLTGIKDNAAAPSATYSKCMTRKEFSVEELKFSWIAAKYGFSKPALPSPTGAPCTAVRNADVVIGSEGELYKCYESVGSPGEVIGNIKDFKDLNSNVRKWLDYSPFRNTECRKCVALPVCMGGCPHHAFDLQLYEDRCGTFRHNHMDRIALYIDQHLALNPQ